MYSITAGTDAYGRVKTIAGTPIVTKFAMLQFLPIYPLESMYFLGTAGKVSTGIPFFAETHSVTLRGVPLARLDKASVVMAYIRCFFATCTLFGSFVIVSAVSYLNNQRMDDIAILITEFLAALLLTGLIGGLFTYAIPLTSQREREIREHCAEVLGLAADPARIPHNLAASLQQFLKERLSGADDSRIQLICDLTAARCKIAQQIEPVRMEAQTDELLKSLRQLAEVQGQRSLYRSS